LSNNVWSQQAEMKDVDVNQLMNEIQLTTNDPDKLNLIWWVPKEFWKISFTQDPTISPDQADEMMQLIEKYNVLIIVQGKLGLFGGVTYESAEQLFEKTSMKDHYGDSHFPIKRENVLPDMTNFLDSMKPIMANLLGSMGENLSFLVFDAKNSSNKEIADSYKDHDFEIVLKGDESYKFDLPFSALLLPKICPEDNTELNGKWSFCPIHGSALREKKN